MLKACKQVKRLMEDAGANDSVVEAALIQLQNEAISCPTAPEDAEQMQILPDLIKAEGPMVFTTLTYLLEPSAQIALLPFAQQRTQRALFLQACSQYFVKKACDLIVNILDEIQTNLDQEEQNQEEAETAQTELERLRGLQRQGITELPPDPDEVDDDVLAAPRIFSQSTGEKSEISCALSESSHGRKEKTRERDVERLIVQCKIRIADSKRSSTDLRVEKNELKHRLDQILQFFANVFMSQADEEALRFFAKFAIQQCGFIQTLEMLYFVSQNGYDIVDPLLIIIAGITQSKFSLDCTLVPEKTVFERLENVQPPKKFTFQLCGKTVRIAPESKTEKGPEPPQKAFEPVFSRFSSILPSSVRAVDLRYADAPNFNLRRPQRVSLVDRLSGGASGGNATANQKNQKNSPTTISVNILKLAFPFLSLPVSVPLGEISPLFSRDFTSFLTGVAPDVQRRSEAFERAQMSRFQQVASCYSHSDPAPGQAAISLRFCFVSVVSGFLERLLEAPEWLCGAEMDNIYIIIRFAYEECTELFGRIAAQTGELRGLLYQLAVFRARAAEFLNRLSRLCLACRQNSQYLYMEIEKLAKLQEMQRGILEYNRTQQNPLGVQFQIAEKRFRELCGRLTQVSEWQLLFNQLYEYIISVFCRSRALFCLNQFMQRQPLEKGREEDSAREYFCMLQFAALLHQCMDSERIYQLQEGFRERLGGVDSVDDGVGSERSEELETFAVDTTADLVFIHCFFGGKIGFELVEMAERALFGPISEKQAALDAVEYVFDFIKQQDPQLDCIKQQMSCLACYVVYKKFFTYTGPMNVSFFKKLFSEIVALNEVELRQNPNPEAFSAMFFVKSVRFSALEEPLNAKLNALRRERPVSEGHDVVYSAPDPIASNNPQGALSSAHSGGEEEVLTKQQATNELSEISLADDFGPAQDEVLLDNYFVFAAEYADTAIAAAMTAETLDFAFDQKRIVERVRLLHSKGKFSAKELEYAALAVKNRGWAPTTATLLCDEKTLRAALDEAQRRLGGSELLNQPYSTLADVLNNQEAVGLESRELDQPGRLQLPIPGEDLPAPKRGAEDDSDDI